MIATLALATALILLLSVRLITSIHPARATTRPPEPPRHTADDLATYLDHLAREVRSGRHLAAALADVSRPDTVSADHPDRAIVDHTIAAATRLGGAVPPSLDSAAAVLRERAASAAEAAAHSAQARLSARILTLVPIGFAVWGISTSSRTRGAYLHSPVGLACAVAGVALNLTGWWWMRRTIRSAA